MSKLTMNMVNQIDEEYNCSCQPLPFEAFVENLKKRLKEEASPLGKEFPFEEAYKWLADIDDEAVIRCILFMDGESISVFRENLNKYWDNINDIIIGPDGVDDDFGARFLWRKMGVEKTLTYWRYCPCPRNFSLKIFQKVMGKEGGLFSAAKLIPFLNLYRAFGKQLPRVIEALGRAFKNFKRERLVHDFGQFYLSVEAGSYILKNLNVLKQKSFDEYIRDYKAFCNYKPEFEGLKWSSCVKECRKVEYEGVREEVGEIASEVDMTLFQATKYEQWLEKHKPSPKSPFFPVDMRVTGEEAGLKGDWKMYMLPYEDIRGPVLGLYTDCCQHPGGAGSKCAKHGWKSPLGGFYAVEYKGKIIAQSWAWIEVWLGEKEINRGLCFDNIETLGTSYSEGILELYKKMAEKLVEEEGFCVITVGEGYDDAGVQDLPKTLPLFPRWNAKKTYKGYRDSEEQRLLGGKKIG